MEKKNQGKSTVWRRSIRILFRLSLVFFALLFAIIIALNIPWIQTFIVTKITHSIKVRSGIEVSIKSVKIAFPKTVGIREVYLQDMNKDTLFYLETLRVNIDLFRLLRNEVIVNKLNLENLVAHLHRKGPANTFNFQFIIDAFATGSTEVADTISKSGPPWDILVKEANLKNIHATFFDVESGIDARIDLGNFKVKVKNFDLQKQILGFNEIVMNNTSMKLALAKAEGDSKDSTVSIGPNTIDIHDGPVSKTAGYFTDWDISADKLTIENTNLQFDNNAYPVFPGRVDYQHLFVRGLNTGMHNIRIDPNGYMAEIKNMGFAEQGGFSLNSFSADVQLTGQLMEIKDLQIETPASKISAGAMLSYSAFDDLLNNLGNCGVMLEMENTVLNANELYLFVPALALDSITGKFKNSDVFISAKARGKVDDLNLESLNITLLKNTTLKSHARITGLPDMDKLGFDITIDYLSSSINNVDQFMDPTTLTGLNLPQTFDINGTLRGKTDSLHSNIHFMSAYGNLTFGAFYHNRLPANQDTFNLDFTAQHIFAGLILADTLLGEISFSGNTSGSGISSGPISVKASLGVMEAQYNEYSYKNIQINGQMDGDMLSATASSADTNLHFELLATADLNPEKQKYSAQLNLLMLNLQALNFTKDKIAFATNLNGELGYAGANNLEASLELTKTLLISDHDPVPIKKIDIMAVSTPDNFNVKVNSDLADGMISGNIMPEDIATTLQTGFNKYLGIGDTSRIQPGKQLTFNMGFHLPKDFTNRLIPELQSLNISKLEGAYNSDHNDFSFEMQIPGARYSNVKFDSLSMTISGKDEQLSMNFNCRELSYDSIRIDQLSIIGHVNKGKVLTEIKISDSLENPRYLFANEIDWGNDFYSLRFLPHGLVLDGTAWEVDEGNFFEMRDNTLSTHRFFFSKDSQSLGFTADKESQKFVFTNFSIQNLVNILEFKGKDNPIKGNLAGEIVIPSSEKLGAINADLAINDLYILDTLAGDFVLQFNITNDTIGIHTSIINEENTVKINGDVVQSSGPAGLNLDLLIDINNLGRLERYFLGTLSDMGGQIEGEISLKGTTEEPEINGFVGFEETAFKVNSLNLQTKIADQKIELNNEGIHFHDFVVEDVQAKELTINGDILTTNYKDYDFDLNIATRDFQPVNSTAKDNPVFFGKLNLDTDIHLKGNLESPKIEADIKINKATNLTYTLPGSELKLVSSEGIVYFMDPGETHDSLLTFMHSDYITDSLISKIRGMNLTVNLEIDPDAKFTVDIDPASGDYLTIGGSAKLSISADDAGNQSITGTYEVKSGYYQLSFYNIVKKSFTIVPGSTVSWAGKPMDADVDITAKYVVTTTSVALMSTESASMSEAEKTLFKQRLPYEVKLNVRGQLAQPDISFNITLPEKYLAPNPLIASRLAQLNSEDMASDLNKQVFALLVTGTFIADNPMDATGGPTSNVASTAARNSVNGILADQMNKVSGKYIQFVDVNFGLTSFDDGTDGSSDTRTDLDLQVSKKLFHDRITLEAQGSVNLEGNKNNTSSASDYKSNEFTMTYDLKEDGDYKLKTYYQTGYDIFDGEITYGGVAVMFVKEFESLKKQKKQNKKNKYRKQNIRNKESTKNEDPGKDK